MHLPPISTNRSVGELLPFDKDNAVDDSGNKNHGKVEGAQPAKGKFGHAMKFTGRTARGGGFSSVSLPASHRRPSSCDSRTGIDWAKEIKRLLDEDYLQAQLVTLVCDNLNIHVIGSLYKKFDAPTADRLAKRLRIVHTPRNGSWLHMAEIELSILKRQCIGRRFESASEMQQSIAAWLAGHNQAGCGANWRFTTDDASIKLKGLYLYG